MTRVKVNKVDWPKPEGYDERDFELLLRNVEAGDTRMPFKPDPMPNGKTDTNNNGAFSTDFIGQNYDYPEASYARRREIELAHERYQKGFFYTLANNPRVPAPLRESVAAWGLSKDEFTGTGNWPHQIYVREARRMRGALVQTERHCRALDPIDDSVGMGSYNMDSHNCARYVTDKGLVQNEGDIQVSPGGAYPISYRALTPKAGDCRHQQPHGLRFDPHGTRVFCAGPVGRHRGGDGDRPERRGAGCPLRRTEGPPSQGWAGAGLCPARASGAGDRPLEDSRDRRR
jgi:hypothetical protein